MSSAPCVSNTKVEGRDSFSSHKVATQGRPTSSDCGVSASWNLLASKCTHSAPSSLVSWVIRCSPPSETGQDALRSTVLPFGGMGAESGPLLALWAALVVGIINSEFPPPYWNVHVVEKQLPLTGLREAAGKHWRGFLVCNISSTYSELLLNVTHLV